MMTGSGRNSDTHRSFILAGEGRDDQLVFRRCHFVAPLVEISLIIPGTMRELEGAHVQRRNDVD